MSAQNALALAIICFIAMVVPGPGLLGLLGHTLSKGLRRSVGFIIGMVCGDLAFLLLVIGGLSVIAGRFETTFTVIRLAAAAYLIFLGIKAWRSGPIDLDTTDTPANNALRGFVSGLLLTLSNPKVIIFYVGILPGFIDLTALAPLDAVLAVAIVLGVLVCVLVSYAFAAARARTLLRSERALKVLNRGAGSVMIGAGVTIIAR
ncbi:MAG: LysE family translocator [Rhodospirillaceae bacterium]|nr:LysE family translocator [Rhodospirillaceae bacterium]MBL6930391.1 LysE family translocator [Rhodospirillales bacterium]MBL6941651.1 LysE family translocator [Rhodospirillales bacterium]